MKPKAFTLIELLVGIAIIAILAAILFPVFAQAKAAAKKTACLSNGNQIGISLMLYLNAYDDSYPQEHPSSSNPAVDDNDAQLEIPPIIRSSSVIRIVCHRKNADTF